MVNQHNDYLNLEVSNGEYQTAYVTYFYGTQCVVFCMVLVIILPGLFYADNVIDIVYSVCKLVYKSLDKQSTSDQWYMIQSIMEKNTMFLTCLE
jgi:hypothetical protein